MSFLFKNYSLVEVIYLLIRCYKTRFFLRNTNNTDRNGVNKQNTHTHTHTHTPNTQRKVTLERVSLKISDTPPPFFKTTPPILTTILHCNESFLPYFIKRVIKRKVK